MVVSLLAGTLLAFAGRQGTTALGLRVPNLVAAAHVRTYRRLTVFLKLAVVLWAAYGLLRGLAVEFVMSDRDPPDAELYIDLLFIYPFFACLPSLLSRRLTMLSGLALGGCAVWAAAILYRTTGFGHGAAVIRGELVDIAIHPALSAAVLLGLAWYEVRSSRVVPA